MATHSRDSEPSFEQAFAALHELATTFMGPVRPSDGRAAALAAIEPPASAALPEAPSGTIVLDHDGLVLHLDGGAERLFQCEAAEMIGNRIAILVVGDLPGAQPTTDAVCRRRDGSTFPAELTRSHLRVGQHDLVLLTVRDKALFARVVAEQRTSELRFQHLVEQIPAVTFTAALQGGLSEIYVSPQIEQLLGYSQKEWVSNPVLWYERLHPEDRTKLDAEFARGCMTGGPFRAECRFIARSGVVVWVHGEARIIRDSLGRPLFLQGVAFNVTDIRRLHEEQAARMAVEREHRREKLLSQVSQALAQEFGDNVPFQAIADLLAPVYCDWCLIDAIGDDDAPRRVAVSHPLRADPARLDAVRGRSPDWGLGPRAEGAGRARPIGPILMASGTTAVAANPECARIMDEVRGGSLITLPLRARDRVLGMLTLVAEPWRPRLGDEDLRFGAQLAERIAILLDNARLYRQAKEAIGARDTLVKDLERAVHFSEMFIGILGHDLRNPLGSIVTAASLLERRARDATLARPLSRIFSSADRMRRMIDQILDFTHIRLGRGLPLHRGRTDLAKVCRGVVDEFLSEGSSADIELKVRGSVMGQWDGDRLSQLISNLVGNGLQHRAGGAPVQLRVDGTGASQVTLEVWNQGAVAVEILPVIFQPFRTTAGGGKQSGSSGLGLGLFISREIAAAHGGTIDISSSEADGTCFTLRLPRRSTGRDPAPEGPKSAVR